MSFAARSLPLVPVPLPVQEGGIFVSIHLNSNRPEQIVRFLEAVERTAAEPSRVEVIVHIDTGDNLMLEALQAQQKKLTLTLKWLATDLIKSFADTWKPYNLLLPMTNPSAYFITLLSDEVRFEQPGWDRILATYVGYFSDHIFRLRGSQYRFRNYTDPWECGFAPDSLAFYTRDWLMIQGDWNPCNGPDSFQQCISYYLFTSDPFCHTQYYRDIQLHFMKFSGEGANVGMDEESTRKRMALGTRMWFILMSHRYQQEAKRRAMLLKAHMYARTHPAADQSHMTLADDPAQRSITLLKSGAGVVAFSYGLSRARVTLRNLLRIPCFHYYGGCGHAGFRSYPWRGIEWMLDAYCPPLGRLLFGAARKRARIEREKSG